MLCHSQDGNKTRLLQSLVIFVADNQPKAILHHTASYCLPLKLGPLRSRKSKKGGCCLNTETTAMIDWMSQPLHWELQPFKLSQTRGITNCSLFTVSKRAKGNAYKTFASASNSLFLLLDTPKLITSTPDCRFCNVLHGFAKFRVGQFHFWLIPFRKQWTSFNVSFGGFTLTKH